MLSHYGLGKGLEWWAIHHLEASAYHPIRVWLTLSIRIRIDRRHIDKEVIELEVKKSRLSHRENPSPVNSLKIARHPFKRCLEKGA
jgi:hypothetical protein